jgi:multidrug transporter EmrE-like cation transporter
VSIWSAITLALVATCCYQLGTVLQKMGADRMPRLGVRGTHRHAMRAFLRSPIWLSGLAVSVAGWVLFLKAIANAPVSIVQPVLGFGLCLLAFLSVVLLRERLRPVEWVGIALMVSGIVLLGVSAAQEHDHATAVSRLALTAASLAILGVLAIAVHLARAGQRISLPVVLGFASGVLVGLGALYTKALFVSLGNGSALIGWGVFLPLTILTNVIALWITQAAFQRGRALIVVAMNAVTNKVITIGGAMAALGELLPTDARLAAARLAGFVAILLGTVILARFGAASAPPPSDPAALHGPGLPAAAAAMEV